MSFACLWIPSWPTGAAPTPAPAATSAASGTTETAPRGEAAGAAAAGDDPAARRAALVAALLALSPHVSVESREGLDGGALLWLDGRGLPGRRVARQALRIAREHGLARARVGLARTAIVAEAAATSSSFARGTAPDAKPSAVTIVPPDGDAAFLEPLPLALVLRDGGTPALAADLADVGLRTCGDLARLTRAAVEIRFGAEGTRLWQLARADATASARRALALFPPRRRTLPSASLGWDDYAVRDLERLAFVVNRLAATVCDGLRAWGEGARAMTATVALADRTTVECPVRAGRPTASRGTWSRLVRAALDRADLPDAVVGLALRVDAAGDAAAVQGDLFDRGFQAGPAVEEALAQLVDDRRATIVGLAATRHPLLERRTVWRERDLAAVIREDERRGAAVGGMATGVEGRGPRAEGRLCTPSPTLRSAVAEHPSAPGPRPTTPTSLALQLLPVPRRVRVRTERRRAHQVPVRFADPAPDAERGGWPADVEIVTAAGPDHVAGDEAHGAAYAREYFHALTADGVLVLLFRDAAGWHLHGWWD